MSKYRKLPVEVEAIQWNGNNYLEIYDFVNNSKNDTTGDKMHKLFIKSLMGLAISCSQGTKELEIETLEGTMIAKIGDYIIKGVERRSLSL